MKNDQKKPIPFVGEKMGLNTLFNSKSLSDGEFQLLQGCFPDELGAMSKAKGMKYLNVANNAFTISDTPPVTGTYEDGDLTPLTGPTKYVPFSNKGISNIVAATKFQDEIVFVARTKPLRPAEATYADMSVAYEDDGLGLWPFSNHRLALFAMSGSGLVALEFDSDAIAPPGPTQSLKLTLNFTTITGLEDAQFLVLGVKNVNGTEVDNVINPVYCLPPPSVGSVTYTLSDMATPIQNVKYSQPFFNYFSGIYSFGLHSAAAPNTHLPKHNWNSANFGTGGVFDQNILGGSLDTADWHDYNGFPAVFYWSPVWKIPTRLYHTAIRHAGVTSRYGWLTSIDPGSGVYSCFASMLPNAGVDTSPTPLYGAAHTAEIQKSWQFQEVYDNLYLATIGKMTCFGSGYELQGFNFAPADVNTSSDQVRIPGHGLMQGQGVKLTTSGGLPAGLSADMYVVVVDSDNVSFSSTVNGSPVNITSQGTGNHTLSFRIRYFGNSSDSEFISGVAMSGGNAVCGAMFRYGKMPIPKDGVYPPADKNVLSLVLGSDPTSLVPRADKTSGALIQGTSGITTKIQCPPRGEHLVVYKDRLILAGNPTRGYDLFRSDTLAGSVLNYASGLGFRRNLATQINSTDTVQQNNRINGLDIFSRTTVATTIDTLLAVFKPNSVHVISGDWIDAASSAPFFTDDFQIRQLSKVVGLRSPAAKCLTNVGLLFLGQDNLYAFNPDGEPSKLGDALVGIIGKQYTNKFVNDSTLKQVIDHSNPWMSFGDGILKLGIYAESYREIGDSYNADREIRKQVWLDLRHSGVMAWSGVHSFETDAFSVVSMFDGATPSNTPEKFLSITLADAAGDVFQKAFVGGLGPYLVVAGHGYDTLGTPVKSVIVSPEYDFGYPGLLKSFRHIGLTVESVDSGFFSLQVVTDSGQFSQTKTFDYIKGWDTGAYNENLWDEIDWDGRVYAYKKMLITQRPMGRSARLILVHNDAKPFKITNLELFFNVAKRAYL